jgi:hypothetical protein
MNKVPLCKTKRDGTGFIIIDLFKIKNFRINNKFYDSNF